MPYCLFFESYEKGYNSFIISFQEKVSAPALVCSRAFFMISGQAAQVMPSMLRRTLLVTLEFVAAMDTPIVTTRKTETINSNIPIFLICFMSRTPHKYRCDDFRQ